QSDPVTDPGGAGLAQQREPLGELGGVEVADHLGERGGVRARRHDAVLRALELRRGHELHRLGDLARVLDGLDAPAQLAGLRHQCAAICLYSSMAARLRISWPIPGCCAVVKSRKPCAEALLYFGATSSRHPF